MEKSMAQISDKEPIERLADGMRCLEEADQKEASVDLGRRSFFLPRKRVSSGVTKNAPSTQNTPDGTAAGATQDEEARVEPVVLKEAMVSLIRTTSAQSRLTSSDMFSRLLMQDALWVSDEHGEAVLLDNPADMDADEKIEIIRQAMQELLSETAFEDIVEMVGEKNHYYYSTKSMSSNYARLSMLVEEKDHCAMIAEVVRFECVTYPRPYAVEMLQYAPFFMSKDEIDVAVHSLKTSKECEDILMVQASNNAIYLFSSKHMTYGMAKGLCEWIEVEQFENP